MRSSWLKCVLIAALLFLSNGSHAHTLADHAGSQAMPCAGHHHHHDQDHRQCCCDGFACLADLIAPAGLDAPHPVAYSLTLTPRGVFPLADRFQPPELDPPRSGI
jgi:hypothetical protein